MPFDPFGDFEECGYLRNFKKEKNIDIVKIIEHEQFCVNIKNIFLILQNKKLITYEDLLKTHKCLFSKFYPWAGQDRLQIAESLLIGKGRDLHLFAYPKNCSEIAGHALILGNNIRKMREKPGYIMARLAHAHPFLDGNGRTIMTVHTELCRRAGFHIDWSQTNKKDYLLALTKEIKLPGDGHLDAYLKPYLRKETLSATQSVHILQKLPGLGPKISVQAQNDENLEKENELKRRYNEKKELYIQIKKDQAERIESKLKKIIKHHQKNLQEMELKKPKLLTSLTKKRNWRNQKSLQERRLQTSTERLEVVCRIKKKGIGNKSHIELLGIQKMRLKNPELSLEYDSACKTERHTKITTQREKKVIHQQKKKIQKIKNKYFI